MKNQTKAWAIRKIGGLISVSSIRGTSTDAVAWFLLGRFNSVSGTKKQLFAYLKKAGFEAVRVTITVD